MSMFDGMARLAAARLSGRAMRRTARLIEALPAEVQKDIGWRWSPRGPGSAAAKHFGWVGQ